MPDSPPVDPLNPRKAYKPTSLRLSPRHRRALRLLAQQERRSQSAVMEFAIEDRAKAAGLWVPEETTAPTANPD